MISKKHKRTGSGKLLSLKKHGGLRREQEKRGHCPIHSGMGCLVNALAAAEICHLIMILQEMDEGSGFQSARPTSATLPLPGKVLSLVQKTALHGGDKLLRRAAIIGIIGFVMAGLCHHGGMMKIIVPHYIH